MSELYKSIDGQSLVDVCLNTYGSLDNFIKLLQDSAIESSNVIPPSGQSFYYDKSLVIDQQVNRTTTLGNIRYATVAGSNGNTFYVIQGGSGTGVGNPGGGVYVPPSTLTSYEKLTSTEYTIIADGQLLVSIPALIGKKMVQVELEQKPLKSTEWSWNKTNGLLTLNGVFAYQNQTLFLLYSQIVSV